MGLLASGSSPLPVAMLAPHVSKFGGTSVASPERIRRVVELVTATAAEGRTVVVVSALGGTTDDLLAALDAALARGERLEQANREVSKRLVDAMERVRKVLEQHK